MACKSFRVGRRWTSNTRVKEGSDPMNWDRVEGNWKEFKARLQEVGMTNHDLDVATREAMELWQVLSAVIGTATQKIRRTQKSIRG